MNITHFYAFLAGIGFIIVAFIAFIAVINPHDCANRRRDHDVHDNTE